MRVDVSFKPHFYPFSNTVYLVAKEAGKCSYIFGHNELEAKGQQIFCSCWRPRSARPMPQQIQDLVRLCFLVHRQCLSWVLPWSSLRPLVRALILRLRAPPSWPFHLLTPSFWGLGFRLWICRDAIFSPWQIHFIAFLWNTQLHY